MNVKSIIAHIGMPAGSYIQPSGNGPWHDHLGNIVASANIVASMPGACVFEMQSSQEWKLITDGCKPGHSCVSPLEQKNLTPVGTRVQVNCGPSNH